MFVQLFCPWFNYVTGKLVDETPRSYEPITIKRRYWLVCVEDARLEELVHYTKKSTRTFKVLFYEIDQEVFYSIKESLGIDSILYSLLDKLTNKKMLSCINGIINGDPISTDDSNYPSLSKNFFDRICFDYLKTKMHNPNSVIDIDEILEHYSLGN